MKKIIIATFVISASTLIASCASTSSAYRTTNTPAYTGYTVGYGSGYSPVYTGFGTSLWSPGYSYVGYNRGYGGGYYGHGGGYYRHGGYGYGRGGFGGVGFHGVRR